MILVYTLCLILACFGQYLVLWKWMWDRIGYGFTLGEFIGRFTIGMTFTYYISVSLLLLVTEIFN